ncbi:MAG: hypothetical protein ACI81O_000017 [Cyclobacteriaceae bacterium]|jgi:hypothetical protein
MFNTAGILLVVGIFEDSRMRLRQVALVAEKLEPVREQLFGLLGIEKDFADPGVGEFGLENSVMSIGDTFLEVVAPMQSGTAAGRLLTARGGDGGYMVLLQVDDLAPYTAHTEALQLRKIWQVDRPEVKAFHLHPKDIGAAIVSIDQMNPAASWLWGGPDWAEQTARHAETICAVDIQSEDPQQLAQQWASSLMCSAQAQGDGAVITLTDGQINFSTATDGRGPGVSGLCLAVKDINLVKEQAAVMGLHWVDDGVSVCGTRLRFEAMPDE